MKQDAKKMKKVAKIAQTAKAYGNKMNSRFGMKPMHKEPDMDEMGGPSDMDMDDMPMKMKMKRGKK